MKKLVVGIPQVFTLTTGTGGARMDLATLPKRDSVQLTIYNSADLTLVQETRTLSLANETGMKPQKPDQATILILYLFM